MDRPVPRRGAAKPIAGFAIVLGAALFVGALLYLDTAKKEREMRIAAEEAERAAQAIPDDAVDPASPAVEEARMTTYAAELDGHRFQIDLPEGYFLSVKAGASGAQYAEALSASSDGIALVTIELVAPPERPMPLVEEDAEGHRFVPTADGKARFWLSGEDFEERALPGFDAVAASFKALPSEDET